jgi:hypothetical protein
MNFDVIHVTTQDFGAWVSGRDTVVARVWQKVNDAYIVSGRSIETDKVSIDPNNYMYVFFLIFSVLN